jgi:hypothetical protein
MPLGMKNTAQSYSLTPLGPRVFAPDNDEKGHVFFTFVETIDLPLKNDRPNRQVKVTKRHHKFVG